MIHGKRGEELAINKLIIIILIMIVILGVLFFVFKTDILEWLRNLPAYEYVDDEVIDISTLDEKTLNTLCPVIIGTKEVTNFENKFFNQHYIFIDEKNTGLYFKFEDKDYKYVAYAKSWGDVIVADIKSRDITVKEEILLDPDYIEIRNSLLDLDDAYVLYGQLICKSEQKAAEQAQRELDEVIGKFDGTHIYHWNGEEFENINLWVLRNVINMGKYNKLSNVGSLTGENYDTIQINEIYMKPTTEWGIDHPEYYVIKKYSGTIHSILQKFNGAKIKGELIIIENEQ